MYGKSEIKIEYDSRQTTPAIKTLTLFNHAKVRENYYMTVTHVCALFCATFYFYFCKKGEKNGTRVKCE